MNNLTLSAGFPWDAVREARRARAKLEQSIDYKRPPIILKDFSKKYKDIPTRTDYRGTFEEGYWKHFTKRQLNLQPSSWINPDRLGEAAKLVKYEDMEKISRIKATLSKGADLGCRGPGRLQTMQKNSPSAYEYGVRLVDSLQGWLEDDLACGPLTKEEVEAKLDWSQVSVNPMSVRLKPNGKARIIVDMSAPHSRDKADPSVPASVNSSIDKKEFPATMAGTKEVLHLLYKVGRDGVVCKADWNAAYKHIFVRAEDLVLQFLEFGGKFFMERALVFGCTSSPGIYNEIAATVIAMAVLRANVSPSNVLQCLDDVVNISTKRSGECEKFYKAYREICEMIGVSLAGEEDPGKAFSPCTSGIILGIEYNISEWEWRIPEDKMSYMMDTLFNIAEGRAITVEEALSLTGRINHYHALVPGGKWERGWLQELANNNDHKNKKIVPGPQAMSQAEWWIVNMATASRWSAIPDIRDIFPAEAIMVYPDAAGGSDTNKSLGLGGCIWTDTNKPWVYLPWSYNIRTNRKDSQGNRFARKLSMLEAVAALATVCTHPDHIRNKNIRVASDNIGFVMATRKGNSTCKFTLTIIMALQHVTKALNTGLQVVKTPRTSGPGERVADHLSKGKFPEAFMEAESFQPATSFIPRTLVNWLEKPIETRLLGQAIIEEMSSYTEVLRWSMERTDNVMALVRRRKRKLSA